MSGPGDWADRACREIVRALRQVDEATLHAVVHEVATAGRIALHGVGREGLMMRALAMRLHHLGLQAAPVGDMTAPALHRGDLLLASAGPGHFATVAALLEVARDAGARTVLLTARHDTALRDRSDIVLVLPARTMAEAAGEDPVLPMGSAYEGAQFILFEYLVSLLRGRLRVSEDAMRARHTNME